MHHCSLLRQLVTSARLGISRKDTRVDAREDPLVLARIIAVALNSRKVDVQVRVVGQIRGARVDQTRRQVQRQLREDNAALRHGRGVPSRITALQTKELGGQAAKGDGGNACVLGGVAGGTDCAREGALDADVRPHIGSGDGQISGRVVPKRRRDHVQAVAHRRRWVGVDPVQPGVGGVAAILEVGVCRAAVVLAGLRPWLRVFVCATFWFPLVSFAYL